MFKYQLPKEFATKWIAALRSGEYQQGNGLLRNFKNEYCCLGVACKIQGVSDENLTNKNLIAKEWLSDEDLAKVPRELHGKISSTTLCGELATQNDGGESFSKIANWIEANVGFVGSEDATNA